MERKGECGDGGLRKARHSDTEKIGQSTHYRRCKADNANRNRYESRAILRDGKTVVKLHMVITDLFLR
jgi:hypothetical protein